MPLKTRRYLNKKNATYKVPGGKIAKLEFLHNVVHVVVVCLREVDLCQQVIADVRVVQKHQQVEQSGEHRGVQQSRPQYNTCNDCAVAVCTASSLIESSR